MQKWAPPHAVQDLEGGRADREVVLEDDGGSDCTRLLKKVPVEILAVRKVNDVRTCNLRVVGE